MTIKPISESVYVGFYLVYFCSRFIIRILPTKIIEERSEKDELFKKKVPLCVPTVLRRNLSVNMASWMFRTSCSSRLALFRNVDEEGGKYTEAYLLFLPFPSCKAAYRLARLLCSISFSPPSLARNTPPSSVVSCSELSPLSSLEELVGARKNQD